MKTGKKVESMPYSVYIGKESGRKQMWRRENESNGETCLRKRKGKEIAGERNRESIFGRVRRVCYWKKNCNGGSGRE